MPRRLRKQEELSEEAEVALSEAQLAAHRRVQLNLAMGLPSRHPIALSLNDDELAQAEKAVAEGRPPVLEVKLGGLTIIANPWALTWIRP